MYEKAQKSRSSDLSSHTLKPKPADAAEGKAGRAESLNEQSQVSKTLEIDEKE